MLTRDRAFPLRPSRALLIADLGLDEQLATFFAAYPVPALEPRLFTRCLRCNAPLQDVPLSLARRSLPPRVACRDPDTRRCPACDRLYWNGTHTEQMRRRLLAIAPGPVLRRQLPAEDESRSSRLRCVLEPLGYSWRGFRKKRKKTYARLMRYIAETGEADWQEVAARASRDARERRRLHAILGISVSRFFRDRVDWELLGAEILRPWIADGAPRRAWSLGCASGEEPYSLRMLWLSLGGEPESGLDILATDVRADLIARARAASYPSSAGHHLPNASLRDHVLLRGETLDIGPAVRRGVTFQVHDYLLDPWPTGFDLLMARNGPFTYRADEEHDLLLTRMIGVLRPGGVLFVGSNDRLPPRLEEELDRLGRTLWRLRASSGR